MMRSQRSEVTVIHVYALCTGYIDLDRASMVSDLKPGQPWTVPLTSFLVDHPPGRLLFDTGVHCQPRLDPPARLRPPGLNCPTANPPAPGHAEAPLARR